jgi:hypothetical protein
LRDLWVSLILHTLYECIEIFSELLNTQEKPTQKSRLSCFYEFHISIDHSNSRLKKMHIFLKENIKVLNLKRRLKYHLLLENFGF